MSIINECKDKKQQPVVIQEQPILYDALWRLVLDFVPRIDLERWIKGMPTFYATPPSCELLDVFQHIRTECTETVRHGFWSNRFSIVYRYCLEVEKKQQEEESKKKEEGKVEIVQPLTTVSVPLYMATVDSMIVHLLKNQKETHSTVRDVCCEVDVSSIRNMVDAYFAAYKIGKGSYANGGPWGIGTSTFRFRSSPKDNLFGLQLQINCNLRKVRGHEVTRVESRKTKPLNPRLLLRVPMSSHSDFPERETEWNPKTQGRHTQAWYIFLLNVITPLTAEFHVKKLTKHNSWGWFDVLGKNTPATLTAFSRILSALRYAFSNTLVVPFHPLIISETPTGLPLYIKTLRTAFPTLPIVVQHVPFTTTNESFTFSSIIGPLSIDVPLFSTKEVCTLDEEYEPRGVFLDSGSPLHVV